MYLASQVLAFGVMVGAGVVTGCMFDLYRVVRVLVNPRAMGGVLMDILFWVLATPVLSLMFLAGNWGELRLYVFLGIGLGLFVYFQLASPLVLWSLITYSRWLGRMLAGALYAVYSAVGAATSCYREVVRSLRFFMRGPIGRASVLARISWPKRGARWGRAWTFFRR